jgi:DNA-binding MarR family transcriptional regulator
MTIETALKTSRFNSEQHKALLNVFYTAYCLKDSIYHFLKQYDLTHEQYNVLRILRGSLPNNLCVKNISERMIEKSSNVPRILERLHRKGWIIRVPSEHDRRESTTIITEKALTMLKEIDSLMNEHEKQQIPLTDEEALQLNQLLEKMRANI